MAWVDSDPEIDDGDILEGLKALNEVEPVRSGE